MMKKLRNSLLLSLTAVGLLLAGAAAKADTLTFTLDSAFQTGPAGVFDFTGTIDYTLADAINDGGVTEFLNGDSVFVDGGSLDDSPYNANAPISMDPIIISSSGDIDLFNVTIPAYINGPASQNTYTGYFSIIGGPTDTSQDVLATEDFEIVVTPEPPTWELMAMALLGFLGFAGWHSLRRQTATA
jgi:hypothetical protein